jgi:hypothetical protein
VFSVDTHQVVGAAVRKLNGLNERNCFRKALAELNAGKK